MDTLSDEDLVCQLAAGREAALAPLHGRYAALIFNLAARSLDRAAAEEIVQDVFVAVWRKADTYDPARGPVRPWLLRIAHLRIVNELRRRGRRPVTTPDPNGLQLAAVPDHEPEPDEAAWREYRRAAVQEAVAALPPSQRQALSLAFFEELTHEQIATFLGLPLGTAKTRIRAGLRGLRLSLVGLLALTVALTGGLAMLAIHDHHQQATLRRHEAALRMVTASDVTAVRLVAAPGVPADTHGTYRTRPDADLAVLTVSHFAPAPAGQTYQAWARHDGTWRSLGVVELDSNGSALVIVDQRGLGAPDALQVTLEPAGGGTVPSGSVVIAWTGP
jgi:RNA polymerase sigma-70 factor (ECF subfamily)